MNIYNYVHSKMKIIIMEEKMVQCPFFVYYLSFLIFFSILLQFTNITKNVTTNILANISFFLYGPNLSQIIVLWTGKCIKLAFAYLVGLGLNSCRSANLPPWLVFVFWIGLLLVVLVDGKVRVDLVFLLGRLKLDRKLSWGETPKQDCREENSDKSCLSQESQNFLSSNLSELSWTCQNFSSDNSLWVFTSVLQNNTLN